MYIKFTNDFIFNCYNMIKSGKNICEVAKIMGINPDHLSKRIRQMSLPIIHHYRPPSNRKQLPDKQIISEYVKGDSVLFLSKKYKVSRSVISTRLRENGIQLRNGSNANLIRFSKMTSKKRKQLTKKANKAVRGKSNTKQHLHNISIKIQKTKTRTGIGEKILNDIFIKHGFQTIRQFSFQIYNIDILVNNSIAVEIINGSYNPIRKAKTIEKVKNLLKSGYSVFFITFTKGIKSLKGNIDNIISDLNILCSNHSSINPQYRVIRCTFKDNIIIHNKLGQFSYIPSPIQFLYWDKTSDFCIS